MDVHSIVLLSHEVALRRRLDATANNIANMNTTGFRRETPVFHNYVERMREVPTQAPGARVVNYVLDYGTMHDMSPGAFKPTGSPLDVAIGGQGYFGVQLENGAVAYTRNGHFEVNGQGVLVTGEGRPVLSAEGQPIAIPLEQRARISIAADGTIAGPDGPIGRIGVFRFANDAMLSQRGDGLFDTNGAAAEPVPAPELKTGGLEESNVNGVAEAAEMVEILRSYQSSQRMTENINELRRSAIQRLGRME